jgi:hypothetical protein
MNTKTNFELAKRFALAHKIIFYLVLFLSALLLTPKAPTLIPVTVPILVSLTVIGPILLAALRTFQVAGNTQLRESQYNDAFEISIGEGADANYYNNDLKPSVKRLGATTLENTKFTLAIIESMLWRSRFSTSIYTVIFMAVISSRQTELGWILLATQSAFSGSVILQWFSMERFRLQTKECRQLLKQHYAGSSKRESLASHAVILRAFTNYECAKDEFATPFSQKIFDNLNPTLSKEWEAERSELGL